MAVRTLNEFLAHSKEKDVSPIRSNWKTRICWKCA